MAKFVHLKYPVLLARLRRLWEENRACRPHFIGMPADIPKKKSLEAYEIWATQTGLELLLAVSKQRSALLTAFKGEVPAIVEGADSAAAEVVGAPSEREASFADFYEESDTVSVPRPGPKAEDPNVSHESSSTPKFEVIQVPFHGHDVLAARMADGRIQVFVKRISDRLGLDWESQRQRIERNQILNDSTCKIQVLLAQHPETTLALSVVHFWLAGISLNQVSADAREMALAYQRECADALFRYFTKGYALDTKRMADEPHVSERASADLRELQFRVIRPLFYGAMAGAADYDRNADPVHEAFGRVTNLAYVAATSLTAAGLVLDRCSHLKEKLGLTIEMEGHLVPTLPQLRAGANYLHRNEEQIVAIIWNFVLRYIDAQKVRLRPYFIRDIVRKTEEMISFLECELAPAWSASGERQKADQHARTERDRYVAKVKEKREPRLFN